MLAVVQAHVNSKKYQQLVRESGQPAPAPIIMVKQLADDGADSSNTNGSKSGAAAGTGASGREDGEGKYMAWQVPCLSDLQACMRAPVVEWLQW